MDLDSENWGQPPQEWLDIAREHWQGNEQRRLWPAGGKLPDFEARCKQAFAEKGFEFGQITVWINTMLPKEGDGYDDGFPHTHSDSDGPTLTIVHYLEADEDSPSLHVLDGNEVVQEVTPEPGLSVFVPSGISHGVLKNNGTKNRTALICLARQK